MIITLNITDDAMTKTALLSIAGQDVQLSVNAQSSFFTMPKNDTDENTYLKRSFRRIIKGLLELSEQAKVNATYNTAIRAVPQPIKVELSDSLITVNLS